jgi:hypothetical protein
MPVVDHSFVYELVTPAEFFRAGSLPFAASADSRLLAELSDFRGRVLYANGRRPRFQSDHGLYNDEDPQDLESFHVIVRHHGALVACLRLTPALHSRTFIGRLLGADDLNAVLCNMGLTGQDCVEAGRWIVLPSARGTDLAKTLLLSCWAVGRWLDKRCLFGLAGTRDGQAKMICRTGGQRAPGIEARFVQDLDDEVSLVYFDLDRPPQFVAAQLPSVLSRLRLGDGAACSSLSSLSLPAMETSG